MRGFAAIANCRVCHGVHWTVRRATHGHSLESRIRRHWRIIHHYKSKGREVIYGIVHYDGIPWYVKMWEITKPLGEMEPPGDEF